MAETAIIIRTKNEQKYLGVVLGSLSRQTYKDFEIIIVDSGSTDNTLAVAKKYPVKILNIAPQDFSYPFALNFGIERCEASKYIVIISGHSVPISNTWLADGIKNFSRYEKIMGVYGFLKPLPGADWRTWLVMEAVDFWRRLKVFFKERRVLIERAGMGVMGFTNAIILKELWDKKHFNEDYGLGGEDGEWADYWFKRGYKAIKDERFNVRHSHSLGFWGWYKQRQHWRSLSSPQPFHTLSFRKDGLHQK